MAQYDEIFKHLTHSFPKGFAKLCLGTTDVDVLETLDTEQQTIKVHRNDMTYKVRWHDEEVILHIEAQTQDSRDKPMPLRMLVYASELLLRHELPVYSAVIYLSPNAGRSDPGGHSYGTDAFGLQHKYRVIRLADLEGERFLETVGLLPFTALMKPPAGMDTEMWLRRCVEQIESAPVDTQTRGTLLFGLSIFGSLAHDLTFLRKFMSEDIMKESPFYELIMQKGVKQGIEQGIEQGSRQMSIKNILSVLAERFPGADLQSVEEVLASIQDIDQLSTLILTAIHAPDVQAFLQACNGHAGV